MRGRRIQGGVKMLWCNYKCGSVDLRQMDSADILDITINCECARCNKIAVVNPITYDVTHAIAHTYNSVCWTMLCALMYVQYSGYFCNGLLFIL